MYQSYSSIPANLYWSQIFWTHLVNIYEPVYEYCVYIYYRTCEILHLSLLLSVWFVNLFAGRLVYDRLKEKAVYIPAGSGVARSLPGDLVKPYGKLSFCCNFLRWHKFKFNSTVTISMLLTVINSICLLIISRQLHAWYGVRRSQRNMSQLVFQNCFNKRTHSKVLCGSCHSKVLQFFECWVSWWWKL